MYIRLVNLDNYLKRKSFFVFGPRQTGKTTFLEGHYPEALYINLLRAGDFRELVANPEKLEGRVQFYLKNNLKPGQMPIVILDEVQKTPALLDEVHRLIEQNKELRFILTGSSPRKLKRFNANMLGGRASMIRFHSITSRELQTDPQEKKTWKDLLLIGGLPPILKSKDPFSDLEDYLTVYLKEEIEEEGLSRSLGGFSRFLNFAALRNGEQLNFTSLGSDAQLSPVTVKEYFQILHDTLIGTLVEPFHQTKKRKAMMSAKFYFFDMGVVNALVRRTSLAEHSSEWGMLLESLIFNEIQAYLDYNQVRKKVQFWRSTSKLEVDFIVWDEVNTKEMVAIEVKATASPTKKHCSGLNALAEEFPRLKKTLVCNVQAPTMLEGDVEVLPVSLFLEKLWKGELV